MSVYRPKNSPYYQFDFQWEGSRFHGSTKRKSRREAEAVERAELERAKREAAATKAASTSLRLDDVAGRYWTEVGQHHAGKDNTWRDIARIVDYFGANKLLTDITDDDVAKLVAWRRGHRIVRSKKKAKQADLPLIKPATVNRSTTEVLRKLFTRAKDWGVRFDREPRWRRHMLAEPQERVRELVGDEGDRLDAQTRADYLAFFAFARATGLRLRECLLKWSEVDWDAGQIRKPGKGGRTVVTPMTAEVRAILAPLRGHHPEHVFTYVAARTRGGRVKGHRYPITCSGLKTTWRRLRAKAEVAGFRFHDFRHDVGTKLLRQTGNLKLVQKALNHADIKTTAKYAHVLTDEVAAALEQLSESRKKSRNSDRKAG
ncbi:MAG: site-specific integrase [Methylacidiphilales bacterium]|nr:site-specific integrase [Candidatus Methylacidiphilales bacterium]